MSATETDLFDKSGDSWTTWLRWLPTSNDKLIQAENKILQRCKCQLERFFLPIFDSTYYLRTVIARNFSKEEKFENNTPIVLLHGFAAGLGLWCKNYDSLSKYRRVYALDHLGFGRSSRPDFPTSAEEVEDKFVQSVEEWRIAMKLDKFILIGHSMGGFVAASYAIVHPQRVAHLVLVDPWGFIGQTENATLPRTGFGAWVLKQLSSIRALSTMRLLGPLGPLAMRKVRSDFAIYYHQTPDKPNNTSFQYGEEGGDRGTVLQDVEENVDPWQSHRSQEASNDTDHASPFHSSVVYNYLYHINCRHPSGEDAFLRMSQMLGWAARPMLHRIDRIDSVLPITFIYGGRSWVDMSSGLRARCIRANSYVDVMVIEGGGHHAYAQYADEFNAYVNAVASLVDCGHHFHPGSEDTVVHLAEDIEARKANVVVLQTTQRDPFILADRRSDLQTDASDEISSA